MNKLVLLTFTLMTAVFAVGCQKDQGGGEAAPPCGPAHYVTPAYGNQCLPRASCQPGHVQNPTQPSMCMNIYTGDSGGPQQCGTGYVLTTHGCLPQCPGQPGKGLYGHSCVDAVAGSSYNNYYNGGYQQQYPYGQPYGNPYYYNPYYRPF